MAAKAPETNAPAAAEAADKPPAAPTAEKEAPTATSASGGLMAWLPLIVMLVLMPALAFAMTRFVLVPRVQHAVTAAANAADESQAPPTPESVSSAGQKTTKETPGKEKEKSETGKTSKAKPANGQRVQAPLGKVLVNLAGSMGSRYLMANLTLVGTSPNFTESVENNKDQLMDLASGVLYSKSVSDLEQAGARNIIRNELRMAFNNALGEGAVQEVYLTEFVIQ
jgi:flagellar FliL protein